MIKFPTSYGPKERQMYDTSEYLEASAISKEKIRRLEISFSIIRGNIRWIFIQKERLQMLQFEIKQGN